MYKLGRILTAFSLVFFATALFSTSAHAQVTEGINFSGYVETSYTFNFDQPDDRTNALRIFDTRSNDFSLNVVKLTIEKPVEDIVGFRADVVYGKDAEVLTPFGTAQDEFDLEQAYIELVAPVGNGLSVKVGHFVTIIGAEVIESPDNYNFSRSFLFGLAIPFTHTGVLAGYDFSDRVGVSFGVVNGWDSLEDDNDAKSFLGGLNFAWDRASLSVAGIVGNEPSNVPAGDERTRVLIDVVASASPVENVELNFNLDWGTEEGAGLAGGDGEWNGVAGIVSYAFNEEHSIAVRGELFNDKDGARTGIAQDLWEITVTGSHWFSESLLSRIEYRHDDSDALAFDGGAEDTQDTISVALSYLF